MNGGFNAWCNASQSSRSNGYSKSQRGYHICHMYKATPMKCPALLATYINLYFALHAEAMGTQDIEGESIAAMWLDSMKYPALRLHTEKIITQDIEGESIAAMWLDSRSIQP